ncbi:MAG: cysteine synthase A [Chloroflexi bacterium]|nr:cysteine synthase A [Chloroflexota bacterium]MCH2524455.1 cysteine synthase A [Dehalococcoidia bacterium]
MANSKTTDDTFALNNSVSIAEGVLDLIGNTPLVHLGKVSPLGGAEIFGKYEVFNPTASVKDRIAKSMVDAAEKAGSIKPGDTLVEPTSGNTGIGLAMVCAAKGYELVLTMPSDMSLERRRLLERFGVRLVLTDALEGMTGAIYAANQLAERHGYFMLQQFNNPANPEVHYKTTGPEIVRDIGISLNAFVAGVGTGGTISGVSRYLKENSSQAKIIAVEPSRAPVLQGGRGGMHGIQGIGASFIPGVLDLDLIDQVIGISDELAYETVNNLAATEGLLVGISAGANVAAAIQIAKDLNEGDKVVTMLCDTGERYLSLDF